MSREFFEKIGLKHVAPLPASAEARGEEYIYVFNTPEPRATALTLEYQPNHAGFLPVFLGLEGGPQLQFRQFVYP